MASSLKVKRGGGDSSPIGTTVDTIIMVSDPAKPNWLNLNIANQLLDLAVYPLFAGISEGSMRGSTVSTGNLTALLNTGSYTISNAHKLNGYFWVLGQSASGTTAQPVFRSSDGSTWSQVGTLATVTGQFAGNFYYLNSKMYIVSYGNGIYESSDLGVTWTRKTSAIDYSTMSFNAGLYIITSTDGKVYSTTDFTTISLRHTFTNAAAAKYPSKPLWVSSLSKWYVVCYNHSAPSAYIAESANGTTWSESALSGITIVGGAYSYCEVSFFDSKIIVRSDNGTNNWASSNGTTWAEAPLLGTASWINYNYSGDTNGTVAGDTLYMYQNTSHKFLSSLSGSQRTVISFGGANQIILVGDGSYVYSISRASSTQLAITIVPQMATANRVILPVQSKMMKVS